MKIRSLFLAHVVCAGALIGCAASKPPTAAEVPKDPPKPEPVKSGPETPVVTDDLRIGNLMTLPKEAETRATNPAPVARNPGNAAVVVVPPTPPVAKPPAKEE